ncbi:MAG TPA: branched-chain amino acid ABC transporter permease [Acidimicrobiales bacterium]|nr:branched-chain amino acid ABC transporter permease [Acidimicrobiales bacterium]
MQRFVDLTLNGVTYGMIYAVFALAIVLIWRATRIVNFAQGAQAMVTTYIAATLVEHQANYWLAVVVALASGLVIGGVIERVIVRPVEKGPVLNPVIVTLGTLVALEALAGIIWGGGLRSFPAYFSQIGVVVGKHRLAFSHFDIYVLVAIVSVMVLLVLLFRFTPLGLRMRASAFAPEVARLLGVRVGRMLTLGWALAGVVGALAGVLVAPKLLLSPNFMDAVFIYGFTAAVIGGLDSPLGAVVGGLATGLALSYVGGYLGSTLEALGALAMLMVVLMLRPQGVFTRVTSREV